jgi:hypothetical protein
VNCEQGVLAILVHSKEAAFTVQHLLTGLTHLPCFNLYQKKPSEEQEKIVVIGSPLQIENLSKEIKDRVQYLIAMEFDYLTSFGYIDCMRRLFASIKTVYILVLNTPCSELTEFK